MTSGKKSRVHGVHVLERALRRAPPPGLVPVGPEGGGLAEAGSQSVPTQGNDLGSPRCGIPEGGRRTPGGHKHQLEELACTLKWVSEGVLMPVQVKRFV